MLSLRNSLLLAALVLASGCHHGEKLGRVFGHVTCDSKPITSGILVFSNPDAGVHMTAELKPDGTYELQTANGFGLPLGTYQVAINPPVGPPPEAGAAATAAPPAPKIPRKYLDFATSGLTLTVGEGENPFDIDMKP